MKGKRNSRNFANFLAVSFENRNESKIRDPVIRKNTSYLWHFGQKFLEMPVLAKINEKLDLFVEDHAL